MILAQQAGFCYASPPAAPCHLPTPAKIMRTNSGGHFCRFLESDQARQSLDLNVERLTDDMVQKKASALLDCCSVISGRFLSHQRTVEVCHDTRQRVHFARRQAAALERHQSGQLAAT